MPRAPKTKTLSYRMTEEGYALLAKFAEKDGLTIPDWLEMHVRQLDRDAGPDISAVLAKQTRWLEVIGKGVHELHQMAKVKDGRQ